MWTLILTIYTSYGIAMMQVPCLWPHGEVTP